MCIKKDNYYIKYLLYYLKMLFLKILLKLFINIDLFLLNGTFKQ